MIDKNHSSLSISVQCKLLGLSRSSYYYSPSTRSKSYSEDYTKEIMDCYIKFPFYGYRRINAYLIKNGIFSTEKIARGAMSNLNIKAIAPGPNTSMNNKEHIKYPYLLRNLLIERVNQVWVSDITYIKLGNNFAYLTAILDIYSRKVLSWRLSNTMDSSFCVEALKEALHLYRKPDIFNTDQGSQYTSNDFTQVLIDNKIKISMDGKGRALDNIYIERLWRSVKYENIYLNDYNSMAELKTGISKYFEFYNKDRGHQSLKYETPEYIYNSKKEVG